MKTVKHLIIGQGLAGTLLAAELLNQGSDFMVLDANSPDAASQVAGGAFIPLVFRTLKKADMIDEYLPAMFKTYESLENLTGDKFLLLIPSLKLFYCDDFHKWQRAKKSPAGEFITELFDSVSIPGLKQGFCGAVIEPSGWVDTKQLTHSWSASGFTADLYFQRTGFKRCSFWALLGSKNGRIAGSWKNPTCHG